MTLKNKFKIFSVAALLSCAVLLVVLPCHHQKRHNTNFTNLSIQNIAQDSVKVFLTIQSPKSVVGMFGIKKSDTSGSCSQGYFYAKKDSIYYLNYKKALEGWNISFESNPRGCKDAISKGFPSGINIVEGSINVVNESFDISCIDGINCIIRTSVTDSSWRTGDGSHIKTFSYVKNKLKHQSNLNMRGIFPYRCTDCIGISKNNKPKNCFKLPKKYDSVRVCQVNRTNSTPNGTMGGTIQIQYWGKLEPLNKN